MSHHRRARPEIQGYRERAEKRDAKRENVRARWDGVDRCDCGKRIFATRELAIHAAIKFEKLGAPIDVYWSAACGTWHLTTARRQA